MTGEQQSADSQPTDQIESVAEAEASYAIPARRVSWLRIYLLVLLAVATATLAVLLSSDPAGRPPWLILLAVAIAVGCLLLAFALGKAIVHPIHPSGSPSLRMSPHELECLRSSILQARSYAVAPARTWRQLARRPLCAP